MSGSSLRDVLARVDDTAPSITAAAAAMMRHYDRSAGVAVNEWRNALQTARPQDLLSLLYVANEVLQNSKRNRGNKFLEAMSPVIGQALQHICQTDPSTVEKVRRTVKIWADRRVFSVRFVNELLQGLEIHRGGSGSNQSNAPRSSTQPIKAPTVTPATSTTVEQEGTDSDEDDDDIMNILQDKGNNVGSDSDSDNDVFGNNNQESEQQKLDLDISIDSSAFHALSSNPSTSRPMTKRRRSSTASAGSAAAARKRTMSISGLLEILNRLATLQQAFERAQLTLQQIDESIASKDASKLAGLIGDELQKEFRQNTQQQQQIQLQRRVLHEIAQEKHTLEQDVARYLPWIEALMKQDDDDLDFCDRLEQKILSFQKIQPQIRQARDVRREQERVKKEKDAVEEEKRREKEEAERFRQAALKRETEEKPGMVWNPVSREYQVIQTDESWRDH